MRGAMQVLLQASQGLPLRCFPERALDGPFCFSRISRQRAGGDGARAQRPVQGHRGRAPGTGPTPALSPVHGCPSRGRVTGSRTALSSSAPQKIWLPRLEFT